MTSTLHRSDLLDTGTAAMRYVERGWAVFPTWWVTEDGRCACPGGDDPEDSKAFCGRTSIGTVKGSPGKHPIATVAMHGVKDASRDPRVIERWFTRYPRAFIGLPAGGNQLGVVDVDLDKSGTLDNFVKLNAWAEKQGVHLMDTLAADTGGGGFHLFFAAPRGVHASSCKDDTCLGCIKNGQGNKPPFGSTMTGIDTRGSGGYVVAAPSGHHSGNHYKWVNPDIEPDPWPHILTRLMEFAARPPASVARRPVRSGDVGRYASAALDRELEALRGQAIGGRNGALNTAAFSLGQLVGAGHLQESTVRGELLSAALSIGLTETESVKSIASGLRAGMARPRQVPA